MRFQELIHRMKQVVFSLQEIAIMGEHINSSQLSAWVRKGYLIKLRNGLYAVGMRRESLIGEEIASRLYEPSYLSMESALSHYGFIPEIVPGFTSITSRTTRRFSNDFGHFTYRHIKQSLFWGFREIHTGTGRYLIAEPEKALLDFFYLNIGHIGTQKDLQNLRLNETMLAETIQKKKLLQYIEAFRVKKLERMVLACLP